MPSGRTETRVVRQGIIVGLGMSDKGTMPMPVLVIVAVAMAMAMVVAMSRRNIRMRVASLRADARILLQLLHATSVDRTRVRSSSLDASMG